MRYRLLTRYVILVALGLCLSSSSGCSSGRLERGESRGEDTVEDRLEAHIGEEIEATVTNTTTGNGPYILTVRIAGTDEVIIHFSNGGYRDISLDEANPNMTDSWSGTDDRGNTWEIEP